MQLIGVVLGTGSRDNSANESKALLEYGFRNFETRKLYSPGQEVTTTPVLNGKVLSVGAGVRKDFYVTLPKASEKAVVAQAEIAPQLTAPLHKGQWIGKLVVKLDGKVATETDLMALEDVGVQSIWQKMGRKIKSWV
jgi:D-alanyl-D-alanine carboxypeptidase (penicillin-binding protein 5/6)